MATKKTTKKKTTLRKASRKASPKKETKKKAISGIDEVKDAIETLLSLENETSEKNEMAKGMALRMLKISDEEIKKVLFDRAISVVYDSSCIVETLREASGEPDLRGVDSFRVSAIFSILSILEKCKIITINKSIYGE